jgi:hypothetical protein
VLPRLTHRTKMRATCSGLLSDRPPRTLRRSADPAPTAPTAPTAPSWDWVSVDDGGCGHRPPRRESGDRREATLRRQSFATGQSNYRHRLRPRSQTKISRAETISETYLVSTRCERRPRHYVVPAAADPVGQAVGGQPRQSPPPHQKHDHRFVGGLIETMQVDGNQQVSPPKENPV